MLNIKFIMIRMIYIVYFLSKSLTLTADMNTPKKENDPRCLIPPEDFCGPGVAYIHSANVCKAFSGGECKLANSLPFKSKKECHLHCVIDISSQTTLPVDVSRTEEKVQQEYENNVTKFPSELLEDKPPQEKHLTKNEYLKNTRISGLVTDDGTESTTNAATDIFEKTSHLVENDYEWFNYKDYMVNHVPRCEQPREVSMCRGFWPRWWFNKSAGECQEFTYGGCGRDDQTTNNFFTQYHCLTECFDIIPCAADESKACNVSTSECATPSCPDHQNVICQVEPCSCKATYIDDFGDQVICTAKTHQNNDVKDYNIDIPQIWILWSCGITALIALVLCIFCCYRCIRHRASYRYFQQETSISLNSSELQEGNFTPRKVFEKPTKS